MPSTTGRSTVSDTLPVTHGHCHPLIVEDHTEHYQGMTLLHEKAFVLKYTGLQAVSSFLSENHENAKDTMSHEIMLSPRSVNTLARAFKLIKNVDFKSGWVARNVIQKLSKEEDTVTCQQIHLFQKIPDARGLAGRLL